jgi:hypothetical protein
VERLVRRALALALGVLLAGPLLFGDAVDLGAARGSVAAALLLAACGAGALMRRGTCAASRRRDAVALTLLVILRGPLGDALLALLPRGAILSALAVQCLTLVPAGLLLGRLLRGALDGHFRTLLVGASLGALAQAAGVLDLLPSPLAVPIAVLLLWWLANPRPASVPAATTASAPPSTPMASAAPPTPPTPVASAAPQTPVALAAPATPATREAGACSAGLLLGAAFALVGLCLRRVVPAYATPTAHPGLDVLLVLLLPAALVSWPAGVLAPGRGARWLGALGGLLLCAAALITTDSLALYENSAALVELKRLFHGRALEAGGLLADWHVWLLSFAGAVAAALGVSSGALRGTRPAACALLGAGLAHVAEAALLTPGGLGASSAHSPLRLLLGAASCGLILAAVHLFGGKGWLALPLAVLPFVDWQARDAALLAPERWRRVAGFDEVRRPGEYSAECFQRSLIADVTVFSTPGPDSRAVEGREAFTQTLSPRHPVFSLAPDGELQTVLGTGHTHATFSADGADEDDEDGEDAPPDSADEPLERFYGVRVAGRALHAQHAPTGAEGSVGRLTRLFGVRGRMLVVGIGAELVAADLHDAGLAATARIASPVPLGHDAVRLLLDHLGSGGWQAAQVPDAQPVVRMACTAEQAGFDTVVVAPGPEPVPGTAELSTMESVERLRQALAPGGRCLLWLDTTGLGARELRARLAAFGAAFGMQSAAFVEPRELDPPFVLLLGWNDEAGRPTRQGLEERLPLPDATGYRTRMRTLEDLAALLLRDGPGLVALADTGPVHARLRPVTSVAGSESGWAAVQDVVDAAPRLDAVVEAADVAGGGAREVFAGLATHGRYAYRLLGLNDTLLEIKADVEWSAFDAEVASYARAAEQSPDDPLLHLALAALLEPLAIVGDLTRFATTWEACHAERLRSWRLALQEAWVRRQGLQQDEEAEALERARRWAAGG